MTKKEQTLKNEKLRNKTVNDSQYLDRMKNVDFKCLLCSENGNELHHVYSNIKGIARNDHLIIPLCSEHHRGKECSPHVGKEAFYKIFSFEELVVIAEHIYQNYLKEIQ